MICVAVSDIPFQPAPIPTEAEKAKGIIYRVSTPLNERQVEAKKIEQILKEGCDVSNRTIEQKKAIAKRNMQNSSFWQQLRSPQASLQKLR